MMIMSVASIKSTVEKEKEQWASERWTFIKQYPDIHMIMSLGIKSNINKGQRYSLVSGQS